MVKDNAIELFLDDLASRKPTPSGGSAAAVMGAMSAALVSMVCNLTIGKMQYRDFEEELRSALTKAEALRRDLTKMLEEDVWAFDEVMRAYGMPRLTKDETTTRAGAIQTALKTATLVPMRCCRALRSPAYAANAAIPASLTMPFSATTLPMVMTSRHAIAGP